MQKNSVYFYEKMEGLKMNTNTNLINNNMDEGSFVQIMPAPSNLYARYLGSISRTTYAPIVCIALLNDGTARYCVSDDIGNIRVIDNRQVYKYDDKKKEFTSPTIIG